MLPMPRTSRPRRVRRTELRDVWRVREERDRVVRMVPAAGKGAASAMSVPFAISKFSVSNACSIELLYDLYHLASDTSTTFEHMFEIVS